VKIGLDLHIPYAHVKICEVCSVGIQNGRRTLGHCTNIPPHSGIGRDLLARPQRHPNRMMAYCNEETLRELILEVECSTVLDQCQCAIFVDTRRPLRSGGPTQNIAGSKEQDGHQCLIGRVLERIINGGLGQSQSFRE
jgi:hypothetical protein